MIRSAVTMPVPAPKEVKYQNELFDWSVVLSTSRLEWIIADLKRNIKVAPDLYVAHAVLAMAFFRAGRYEESERHYRNAMHYAPDQSHLRLGISATLIEQGKHSEALEMLSMIPDDTGRNQVVMLCNMTEALANLGMFVEARAALSEAVRIADHENATDVLFLANQAAAIDADREAVEFFARFIRLKQGKARGEGHALDVISNASPELMDVLEQVPTRRLRATVRRALAFGHSLFDAVLPPPRERTPEEVSAAETEAQAAYDELLPLRLRVRDAGAEDDHGV